MILNWGPFSKIHGEIFQNRVKILALGAYENLDGSRMGGNYVFWLTLMPVKPFIMVKG